MVLYSFITYDEYEMNFVLSVQLCENTNMEMEKIETVHYFDKCTCCLEDGSLRDMWAEYVNDDGIVEIYGQMLNECFSLTWQEPEDQLEKICDRCVELLRTSLDFRRGVLSAKEVLVHLLSGEAPSEKIKIEVIDQEHFQEDQYLQSESLEQGEVAEIDDESNHTTFQEDQTHDVEYLSYEEYKPDEAEMQVEYLEDDEEAQKAVKTRKWPKKKKKEDRRAYKTYTREDLLTAMNMVLSNKMTRMEAAAAYSIPIKTLSGRLHRKEFDDGQDDETKAKQYQFYQEIRTVLTYTNATPYKNRIGRFFCAYCSTSGPEFEPEALRIHTRTTHANERIKNVEMCMRPQYLNEILKVDIHNLHCTVCMTPIPDWNSMFQHLNDEHKVELDQAYNRIIPYILSSEPTCSLCGKHFTHFHMLDCHMNAHYTNYMCGECGDSFLSESRLKKHIGTHSTQRFPCVECGKVFALEKYRKKHFDGVHMKEKKFKCSYCAEVFPGDYQRHQHVVEHHKQEVKSITCEYCLMTFTWRPYYLKHIRLSHSKPEKRFKCNLCTKGFHQKHELKNHLDWHRGYGYTCSVCSKKFSSKNYLQKHIATTHGGDDDGDGDSFIILPVLSHLQE